MSKRPYTLIGDILNHSFGRARRAWENKDLSLYQEVVRVQEAAGADFLDVNIDGTQRLRVNQEEMLAYLPTLLPAIEEVTDLPLCFDNPALIYHKVALENYNRAKNGKPILNSLAASRDDLDGMIGLVKEHDTKVIVMASEKFVPGGGAQCFTGQEVHDTTLRFMEMLTEKADINIDDVIVDPGLAPVSADTYGLVNMGLDAIELIANDPNLKGIHFSVGLTNFSFGVPKELRVGLENAYITLAMERGLDVILASPEKEHALITDPNDPFLVCVTAALKAGRAVGGESQEEAGFRQAEKIMDLF